MTLLRTRPSAAVAFVTVATVFASQAAHAAEEKGGSLLDDTSLWVLVAFLIVMGIAVAAGLPRIASSFFADRADTVRRQLDEARSLREEAQRMLAEYQKRQRDAEEEAQGIIEQAKADAKIMAAEARAKLDDQLTRRRQAAEERIARAEAQAINEMRGKAADLAIEAARDIISTRVDDRSQASLIDKAVGDLRSQISRIN